MEGAAIIVWLFLLTFHRLGANDLPMGLLLCVLSLQLARAASRLLLPPPVAVWVGWGATRYAFSSDSYAAEFARLNGADVSAYLAEVARVFD